MSGKTAPPAGRVDRELLRTAFILVLGTFMATLDATIVSVGIGTLTDEFGASVAEIQWVTTAYLLAVVAAVPASGWLADRFGGRRTWLVAVGVFLLGSVLCACAWSVTSLIVFRVVQGLGGGLLPATGQALLARIAGPGRTGRVISVVAVVPLLSPVFGPLAGGSVLAVAPWPWLFLVNLPIGGAAVLLARRHVPVVPPSTRRTAFDLRGALLLSPGLAVLVYGLTEVAHGRTLPATAGVCAGLVMLAGFTVHGLRTRGTPLVDPGCSPGRPSAPRPWRCWSSAPRCSARCSCCRCTSRPDAGCRPGRRGCCWRPRGWERRPVRCWSTARSTRSRRGPWWSPASC